MIDMEESAQTEKEVVSLGKDLCSEMEFEFAANSHIGSKS